MERTLVITMSDFLIDMIIDIIDLALDLLSNIIFLKNKKKRKKR